MTHHSPRAKSQPSHPRAPNRGPQGWGQQAGPPLKPSCREVQTSHRPSRTMTQDEQHKDLRWEHNWPPGRVDWWPLVPASGLPAWQGSNLPKPNSLV